MIPPILYKLWKKSLIMTDQNSGYGTGRIGEIIDYLLSKYNQSSIFEISDLIKLNALCENLEFSHSDFDDLIMDNSPVLRTVKGHVFEVYFDTLMSKGGFKIIEIGGDDAIDRKFNHTTLQLKTFTVAGTKGNYVQYKTHKTHGAKSERESFDYYHKKDHFADYLVGLISYKPLNLIFISRDELPIHPKSKKHILSPFNVNWTTHPGLNAYERIGCSFKPDNKILSPSKNELLPRLTKFLNVTTDVIMNTILNKSNFRIWDMAIRGFAREIAFEKFCLENSIQLLKTSNTGKIRSDKADRAIFHSKTKKYEYLQVKGVSTNNCSFEPDNLIVAVETQLTRGRVNDHPTQSRLYMRTDFDYLILCLDPALANTYRRALGENGSLKWEFYAIPTIELESHHLMPHRLKSLQKYEYSKLQKYKINSNLLKSWT